MRGFVVVLALVALSGGVKGADLDWWKRATFYQIYPRSFKDNNNDGKGDLAGIIDKLEHFVDIGVTAVWLSPIFKSPQVDQGYDISNYTDVEPDYGTIDDVKTLVELAHTIGIKVILDFVPNHSSDQHQWFIDSVNGVEEFRDYYLWANAKLDENGERLPPNNWISVFKNSAWTWSEERQQYYFHQFAPAQPDLNYRNPVVVEAMKNVLRFWLDLGVDGFRIDAVPHIFEDATLLDEPESGLPGYNDTDYEFLDHIYTKDQPETFDLIYQFRELVDTYTQENGGDQRILMTEAYTDTAKTMLYYGTSDGSRLGAHFTFNFNLITDLNNKSTAVDVANAVRRWVQAIPPIYTSNWVLGNHDQHRIATRLGVDNVDGFNMLTTLLPGVQVTYNGEEIGQENGEVSYEEGQDPSARDPAIFDQVSRDFERTPFQWDTSINAGFNTGFKPWLPVSSKYLLTNLQLQKELGGPSHFKVYQALTRLRKDEALNNNSLQIETFSDQVLFVKRFGAESEIALIFNIGSEDIVVNLDEMTLYPNNSVIITSVDSTRKEGDPVDPTNLVLGGHESLIVRCYI